VLNMAGCARTSIEKTRRAGAVLDSAPTFLSPGLPLTLILPIEAEATIQGSGMIDSLPRIQYLIPFTHLCFCRDPAF